MKHYRPLAWMMAIAIAGTEMTACSLDGNEPEKPFTTCPVSESTLYACGIGQPGTRSVTDVEKVLFTDDDIEWFDASTRELITHHTSSMNFNGPFLSQKPQILDALRHGIDYSDMDVLTRRRQMKRTL